MCRELVATVYKKGGSTQNKSLDMTYEELPASSKPGGQILVADGLAEPREEASDAAWWLGEGPEDLDLLGCW